jgi:hypothetical protein
LSDTDLATIFKEGKERYEKKIPPGYMDKKEKEQRGNLALYGDLIIWNEIIGKFKEGDTKTIFVTDDLKEDWWLVFKGHTIGPRPELLKEFIKTTNKQILIYKPEQFLKYSKDKLDQPLTEGALDEVEKIREFDENNLGYSGFVNRQARMFSTDLYGFPQLKSNYNIGLDYRFPTTQMWNPNHISLLHSKEELMNAKIFHDLYGYLPVNVKPSHLYTAGLISFEEYANLIAQQTNEGSSSSTEPEKSRTDETQEEAKD